MAMLARNRFIGGTYHICFAIQDGGGGPLAPEPLGLVGFCPKVIYEILTVEAFHCTTSW